MLLRMMVVGEVGRIAGVGPWGETGGLSRELVMVTVTVAVG